MSPASQGRTLDPFAAQGLTGLAPRGQAQASGPRLERPFLHRIVGWDENTPADRLGAALARAVSCEVSADSLVDVCYVKPSNGDEFRVAVGAPMPVGDWEGPFQVRPGRANFPALTDPATTTWRTGAQTDAEFGGPLAAPGLPNRLELIFQTGREQLARPASTQRAPFIYRALACTGPTAADELIRIPFGGRGRFLVGFMPLNQSFTWTLYRNFLISSGGSGYIARSAVAGATGTVASGAQFAGEYTARGEFLTIDGHFGAAGPPAGSLMFFTEAQDT